MLIKGPGGVNYTATAGKTTAALKKANQQLQKILQKLSTGQRINTAADDAAGLAVSEQMRTQVRGFKAAQQNVSASESALNIADGGFKQAADIMQRQRELAVAARNDTLTDDQRVILDTEYQALNKELDRLAAGTQYNGQPLANGTGLATGNAQVQAGPNAGDTMNMPRVTLSTAQLGTAGTSIATSAGAQAAMSAIDTGLTRLTNQWSQVGASVNRLGSAMNNLGVAEINTQAAESVLRDQEMAQGLAELTRQRLLSEGAMKAFSRFNEMSQNHIMGLLQ